MSFDNDLPVIDHERIPIGIGHVIKWGFGDTATPENLTGRTAVLIINPGTAQQQRLTLSTDSQWATWLVDSLPWTSAVYPYVLLIAVSAGSSTLEGRVRGTLSSGVRVTP